MKAKSWLTGWFLSVLILASLVVGSVYYADPFFHYHKPLTDRFYYPLDNQRYQNDGIIRNFDYDAMITGTSMTENFKTSELDSLFSVRSIKVPYSGAAFKEVNRGIERALDSHKDMKMVVRSLDIGYLFTDKNWERDDLGEFPEYLYDDDPFNDVKYIFNKDILFNRTYRMFKDSREDGFKPGIITFDEYSYWQDGAVMGRKAVCPDGIKVDTKAAPVYMSEDEKNTLKENLDQNFISLAVKYPAVDFYIYFTPYSMAWWGEQVNSGNVYKYVEAERYAMEQLTKCDNIKLFSYNDRIDITGDLDNYKDTTHYGARVSSDILKWMKDDKGRITRENYESFTKEELRRYLDFDYESLNRQ